MTIVSKIRRQGGAAVMTIPPVLLKLMQMDIGGQLSLSVDGGELIARPISATKKRYSLAELLEGSDAMAELNAQTAWALEGEPVGREL
jgi:antitoxin ChpS